MATPMDSESVQVPKDLVAIRSCEEYRALWKRCSSWSNQFQDYYEYGERQDCSQHKSDYKNCLVWKKSGLTEAKSSLIASERKRLDEQNAKKYHPFWELRTDPRKDWTKKYEDKEGAVAT